MESGEGNGTPLQHFCLENPMDGGAWWAVTLHHFPRVFVICTLRHSDSHLAVAFRQVVMEYISTAFNIFSFQLHAVNQTLAMVKCD